MASNTNNNLSLRSVLEKEKLNGINFLDWHRNLRIVLKQERKLYVLDGPTPEAPPSTAPHAEINAHKKHQDDALDVSCLMLATMNPVLQKQHEFMDAYDMIEHLRSCSKGMLVKKGMTRAKHYITARWVKRNPLVHTY